MFSSAALLLSSLVLVSGRVYQYTLIPAPTNLNYARHAYPFNPPKPLSQVYFPNKKPISQVSSITRTSASATAFRSSDPVSQLFQKVETIYTSAIGNAGDDVVSQTKAHTKGLVGILKEFAADPKAVVFVNDNTAGSSCIKSIEDAISATQAASDLIEKSGPQLMTLLNTYTELKDERDTVALMKGTAEMMLTLDTLVPQLFDFPISTQCRVSPEATLMGMQELANLVNKMANNDEYPDVVRSYLKRSGRIVEASTIFTGNLKRIFQNFSLFCSSDADYNTKAVQAIGDIFNEVTILLSSLGSNYELNEIRQNNIIYATQLVATLRKLRELNIGFFDCHAAFSWKRTGEALLEVAKIVEEVGVEQLSSQLGINLNLKFTNDIVRKLSVTAKSSSESAPQIFQKVKAVYNSAIVNAGDDLVSQTTAHTNGLVGILKEFAANPNAVEFVKPITVGSSCIKSLDDAITATQAVSNLIEESGPELNTLLSTYAELKDEKDTVTIMKGTAQMMLTLDTLIPKLFDFPLSTQCRVSPEATLKGMQELANLVKKMAENSEYPETVRSYLDRSGSIIEATTIFTGNLRQIFMTFSLFCSSDSDYNTKAGLAIGDIFDEVTMLLSVIGSSYDLNEIRQKNINYATQLVDTLEKLREMNLGFFDCNTAFSWERTGKALLEIADIVEEVGVEQLSEQLGINFNLQF